MLSIEFNQLVNFACYLMIGTSSILYIYRLHESSIGDLKNYCCERFTR